MTTNGELALRMEAAEDDDDTIWDIAYALYGFPPVLIGPRQEATVATALRGSMDAALSLLEACLPDRHWVVSDNNAAIMNAEGTAVVGSGIGDKPSQALVAAILRAMDKETA